MKRFIQYRNNTEEEVIMLQKMFFRSLKWKNLFRSYCFDHFINHPQKKPTANDMFLLVFLYPLNYKHLNKI